MKTSSSALSEATPSATALKQVRTDPRLGTLWTVKHSPLTTVLKVVLHLSTRTVQQISFLPLLSSVTMYVRILLNRTLPPWKITAPILRTLDDARPCFLFDSYTIARYVDARRTSGAPTLFPLPHLSTIEAFDSHAQTLLAFARSSLLTRLRSDLPTAAALFLPRTLQRLTWAAFPFLRIAIAVMSMKYARESSKARREDVRRALLAIRHALSIHTGDHLRYLIDGRLTYADIVVAESIKFDEQNSRFAKVFADIPLAEEFADVVAWARAVRQTHCASVKHTR